MCREKKNIENLCIRFLQCFFCLGRNTISLTFSRIVLSLDLGGSVNGPWAMPVFLLTGVQDVLQGQKHTHDQKGQKSPHVQIATGSLALVIHLPLQ